MRGRGRGLGPGFLIEELVPTYPRHAAMMLGFVQMLLGLASFTGAILAEVYYAYNYVIYDGFWCGSFFFASASAALHAGRFPTPRRVRGTIFTAVISFAFVATEFGLSVDGLVENVQYPTAYPATDFKFFFSESLVELEVAGVTSTIAITKHNTHLNVTKYGYTGYDYDFPAMEAANGLMVGACGVEMILLIVQIYIAARALKEYKPQAVHSGAQVVMPPYGHMPPTVTVVGQQQPPFQQMPPQQYYPPQPPQSQQPPFQQMPPQQYYYTNTAFAAPPAYDPSAPPDYVK